MKLSVSLSDDDVAFLDGYAERQGMSSRSAALQKAVRLLRSTELGTAYREAWAEWESGGDAAVWGSAVGDGLD